MPLQPPAPIAPSDPSGPGSRLVGRLQVRHRFAALGVVGVLMCALPLLLVLRHQSEVLGATGTAQAVLDPIQQAVEVQRSLLVHRDLAGAVLRGASAREPERRRRQTEVDTRLSTLELALRGAFHVRATQEGQALREDWTVLSGRIEQRSLAAADSDAAHRLLVEQTLQIVDDLSLAALDLGGLVGAQAAAWLAPVRQGLPRLSARLGLLVSADAGSAEAHPREFAAVQQRVTQCLADLRRLAPSAEGAPALSQALQQLQRQAELYFQQRRDSAPAAALQTAAAGLLDAQAAVQTLAHHELSTALAARAAAVSGQRRALLFSLAVLAVLGAALGLSLLPPPPPGAGRRDAAARRRRFDAVDSLPPADTPPQRSEAHRLLHKLRQSTTPGPRAAPDTQHPHTLPPQD